MHTTHACWGTSQTEPLPIVGFICPLAPCPFTPIVWFLPRVQHQQAGSGDLNGSHIISRLGEGGKHNYYKYVTNHESRVVPHWKMHTPWQLLEIKTCDDKNYRWLFWYTIVRLHPTHKQHYNIGACIHDLNNVVSQCFNTTGLQDINYMYLV